MKNNFKKHLMVFTFLAFANLSLIAQITYTITQKSVTTHPLKSIYFTDEYTGYAVGNNGTIVKTANGGLTWFFLESGTNNKLNSVFFINSQTGWVVGASGTILTTNNGGETWTSQTSGIANNHYNSVFFTDSNTGYIVTQLGTIIKTTDGGITWVYQIKQVQPFLFSIYFTDASTGFAVGGTGNSGNNPSDMKILKTTDGGITWLPTTSGLSSGVLSAIHFIGNMGYVVGTKNNGSSMILKTIDGGNSWIEQSIPTAYGLKSVFFIDINNGFCCGDGGLTFRTTDGGNTWNNISSPSVKRQELNSIFFINENYGWQVCSNGSIIKYANSAILVTLPTISTSNISATTTNSASSGGNITSDGAAAVTARGVCWSTSSNPTINNSKTTDGSGIGSFTSSITGLSVNTTYYVKAYATNSAGTAYGNEISFTTSAIANDCGTVTDIDGNVYNAVRIGNQCWMKENLKTKHYSNGEPIPNKQNDADWQISEQGAFSVYPHDGLTGINSDDEMVAAYGLYYNWYTVVNQNNLCPSGWHVPSDNDWNELTDFISGGTENGGNQLKSCRQVGSPLGQECATSTHPRWNYNDSNFSQDLYGFSAVPSGARNTWGPFVGNSTLCYFLSNSEDGNGQAITRTMWVNHSYVDRNLVSKNIGASVRCVKSDITEPVIVIYTTTTTSIAATSATSGGNITSDGGSAVTSRGVCWNTSPNPTIANSKTTDGSGIGSFTSSITGLSVNTTYYVKAYATNSAGTAYGNEISFTTTAIANDCGTVTDIDGNVYNTVTIGDQCWLKENLKVTKYNDGTPIPNIIGESDWFNTASGAYCWHSNDIGYKEVYGAIYNWYVVDTISNGYKNACPIGWHVPSDFEYTQLTDYLSNNGYGYGGSGIDIAKSLAAKSGWNPSGDAGTIGNDLASNNSSNFSAYPGGYRYGAGTFNQAGWHNYLWTSSDYGANNTYVAWHRLLHYSTNSVIRNYGVKKDGYSVRCMKGEILKLRIPTIATNSATSITSNSASCGGNISNDGRAQVVSRGVCWSTSPNPTIANSKTTDGSGTGSFSSSITGLTANTTYYVKAYATNSVGTAYGNEISFTTSANAGDCGTITDIDGNVYNTVKIGNQCWLKENLKVTHYNNGNVIPTQLVDSQWGSDRNGAYAIYPYSEVDGISSEKQMLNTYGALYNWYVVADPRGVCPSGWNVPSQEQWNDLVVYLDPVADLNNSNQSNIAGGKLKDKSTNPDSHPRWNSPNTNATNETNFSAFPAGERYEGGDFLQYGTDGRFWSSSVNSSCCAWGVNLSSFSGSFTRIGSFKNHGFSIRCIKNDLTVPIISTSSIVNIATNSATSGGNVTSDGGSAVTSRGVCWNTSPNPTIANSKTTDGSGTGSFTSSITGLTANTTYYVKAYATNSVGTAYGNELSFTTNDIPSINGSVTDIDGNVYNTVKIGNQIWMAENLKTQKYQNGDLIDNGSVLGDYSTETEPKYWFAYNDDLNNTAVYGRLYTWYVVTDPRKLCPIDWHVPSDSEWNLLEQNLGMTSIQVQLIEDISNTVGGKIKEVGMSHWLSPNTGATDGVGFKALPAGYRRRFYKDFDNKGEYACFWSSSAYDITYAYYRHLYNNKASINRTYNYKNYGFSVRCVKDN